MLGKIDSGERITLTKGDHELRYFLDVALVVRLPRVRPTSVTRKNAHD
jgi:hypothetical protein